MTDSRLPALVLGLILALAGALWPAAVPAQEGELPTLDKTGVVVPWADFKKILDQLQRPVTPTPTPAPPVDVALSACRASVVVDRDQSRARVELAFDAEVLRANAWVELPLLAAGVALEAVTIDGAPARLFKSGGTHRVALRGRGVHRLLVVYLAPVARVRGVRQVRLRFPEAPAVALELRLPAGELEVTVAGGVLRSTEGGKESTVVRAALGQARESVVSWSRRSEGEEREAKVFAEVATLVTLGEGTLHASTTVGLTIHGRGVERIALDLPAELNVLDVAGDGLEGWELGEPVEGRRRLEARLGFRAKGSYVLRLAAEQGYETPSAEVALPDIVVDAVLRERGFVAVAPATNVEITPSEKLENATPVDPAELPATLGGNPAVLYAFKYIAHPVVASLAVVRHEDATVVRTIVERAELRTYVGGDGKVLTSARYTLRNNRKQYLALTLPEGTRLWGAFRDHRPVKAAVGEEGEILVPLERGASGRGGEPPPFEVEVVLFSEGDGGLRWGRRRLEAPALDVDSVEVSWQLFVPRRLRYFALGGNLEEQRTENRVVVVGDVAYNLARPEDAAQLHLGYRKGRQVVSDGRNEVFADQLEVRGATGRGLGGEELQRLEGEAPATKEAAPGKLEEAEEDRDRLPAPQLPAQALSNIAAQAAPAGGAGGAARGLLPVRLTLPSEGLRLSFAGKLLVGGDAPRVAFSFVPASWRAPRLGLATVLVLGLAFGLGLAALSVRWETENERFRRTTAALTVALGLILFGLAAGHRVALVVAAVLALAAGWLVVRGVRGHADSSGGF